MAIAIVPILMIVVGILIYILAGKAEAKEIGRLTLAAGLIGLAIAYASHMIRLG